MPASGKKRCNCDDFCFDYKQLFNMTAVFFVAFDKSGKIVGINRELLKTLGRKENDLVGGDWFDLCLPAVWARKIRPTFRKIMNDASGFQDNEYYENPIKAAKGGERWVRWHNTLIKDDRGRLLSVSLGVDITENRKKALEHERLFTKIKEQELFFKSTLDAIDSPLYVVGLDYKIRLANRLARERGISEGKFCYRITHRRNTPCDGNHGCPLKIVQRTKRAATLEHKHFDAQGGQQIVEVHGVPIFDDQNRVSSMAEYSFDISQRIKYEQEIKALASLNQQIIDHSPLGKFILAIDGTVEYANNAMAEISGTRKNKLIGLNLFKHPLYGQYGIADRLKKLIETGQKFQTEIIKYKSIDGGKETARIFSGYPLMDQDGNPKKILLAVEDVTKLQEANGDLERFNNLMIGREYKMVELKKEIAELKKRLSDV